MVKMKSKYRIVANKFGWFRVQECQKLFWLIPLWYNIGFSLDTLKEAQDDLERIEKADNNQKQRNAKYEPIK